MKQIGIFLISLQTLFADLYLSSGQKALIADRIWHNECRGSIDGLTSWNEGEEFASIGIGHFIWYPTGKSGRFEETVPTLLQFFAQKGVVLPRWLHKQSGCPWSSRHQFYRDFQTSKMIQLRTLLLQTKSEQMEFMFSRVEAICKTLEQRKDVLLTKLQMVTHDPRGVYAVIDYVNFKGSGLENTEQYQGQGWGLIQVLEEMDTTPGDPVQNFVLAAKKILARRVVLAPPERNERRWLNGWNNRLNTYTQEIKNN